jgi:hypothetical protein
MRRVTVMVVTFLLVASGVLVGVARPADAATSIRTIGKQRAAAPGTAAHPSTSSTEDLALTVWHELVDGTYGIYGRISAADGTAINPRFTISRTAGHDATNPDVAYNGFRWVVVYQYAFSATDPDIHEVIVRTNGRVDGPITVAGSSAPQREPSVMGGYSESSVAYEEGSATDPTGRDIYLATVPHGGPVSNRVRLSQDTTAQPFDDTDPDTLERSPGSGIVGVAWDAQGAVTSRIVLWSDSPLGTQVQVMLEQHRSLPLDDPAAVFCDNEMVVVFENQRGGTAMVDIWGAATGGTEVQPFQISAQAGDEADPAIACVGGSTLAVWSDRRRVAAGELHGTSVDGRAAADPNGVPISTGAAGVAEPALSALSDEGRYSAAWRDGAPEQPTGVVVAGFEVAPK